jgi:hypothetical protein
MGTTIGQHQIHAAINHHQDEHQATMVEFVGMIKNIHLSMLIDYGATNSFISPSSLVRCGLETHDQNDFRMVEMASGVKKSIGPLVKNCIIKIGVVSQK